MRIIPLIFASTLILLVGCDGDTVAIVGEATPEDDSTIAETTIEESDTAGTVMAAFVGSTFVSADRLETGENATGELVLGNWTVSFTTDTVTWVYSDVVEVGSYSAEEGVASFNGRDVSFALDGGDLIWDSLSYRRTAASLFDSQETLVAYLDGFSFDTVEEFDVGESATGELVLGKWSVQFAGDEISWRVQDTISAGTYSFSNSNSFTASFGNSNITVYVLAGGELMVNSIIYKRELASQFSSQESLVDFLNGTTYKSDELRDVGESSPGITELGSWFIDFTDNTFMWTYQVVTEAGTYAYLDDNNFIANLVGRDLTIEVQGDDILWDGVRYSRVFGE